MTNYTLFETIIYLYWRIFDFYKSNVSTKAGMTVRSKKPLTRAQRVDLRDNADGANDAGRS